jgi:hypothetical protein
VNTWLSGIFDPETKDAVKKLQAENPQELEESFYRNLEFGTGGLRGIMGVGTNRMNKYTVGMATQGFANYMKLQLKGEIKVAIAHDCRNNSDSQSHDNVTNRLQCDDKPRRLSGGSRKDIFDVYAASPNSSNTARMLTRIAS